MHLDSTIYSIPGIGYNLAKKLENLNIFTVNDLINHFPFRYDDFSQITNAMEAKVGEKVTIAGEIWSIKNVYTKSKKILTQAVLNDGNAPIELVWFNQGYLTKSILPGVRLQVSGKVTIYKNKYSITAPTWEKIPNDINEQEVDHASIKGLHTGRLVPIYPETFGLSSKLLRHKISQVLPEVKNELIDPLTDDLRGDMLPLAKAVEKIHFPENWEEAAKARDRLGFDELFFIQLATQKARLDWTSKPVVEAMDVKGKYLKEFEDKLPFQLTKAQKRVISQTLDELSKGRPMNRLVQGEVGSGKTVVAAAVIYVVYKNSFKTMFMAPTEILAFQHASTLEKVLGPLGLKVGVYTGSKKFKAEETQSFDVFVGTHALLSSKLDAQNVGLIVVDEQQRFGVEQRTLIRSKAKVPHFLTMTATPIPRTVALTMYGDLDLSVIDELPKGRKPVSTHVVPAKKRDDAYKFIEDKIKNGGDQAYIITPLIELSETLTSVKAAKAEFEKLQSDVFPDLKLGLLHGKLKPKEKEQILLDFRDKKVDILISTSVVEVGVDVPNATIMVIEGAERFGLAQLHQLRGRVGRGEKESYCLLFPSSEDSEAVSRLKNLEDIHNGMKLAELDLKIRGSGEVFGTRQSGRFELKIASLSDLNLIEKTRDAARAIIEKDPQLENHPLLKANLNNLTPGVMPD